MAGVQTYLGSLTAYTTGTGTVAYTPGGAFNFTPAAIIFWTDANTTSSNAWVSSSANSYGFGAYDGTNYTNAAIGYSSLYYASGTHNSLGTGASTNASCIFAFNPSTAASLGAAKLTSVGSGTFSLNWTTKAATAYKVFYLAIGGDVSKAKIVPWQMPAYNASIGVTGVGFKPSLVMHIGIDETSEVTSTSWAVATFGAMDASGNQFASQTLLSSAANAPTDRVQSASYAWVGLDGIVSSLGEGGAFTSMDIDGFTMNFTKTSGDANWVFSLCLYNATAGEMVVGHWNKSTAAAPVTDSLSTGLSAVSGALFFTDNNITAANPDTTGGGRLTLGGTDGTNYGCVVQTDKYGSATPKAYSATYSNAAIIIADEDTGTQAAEQAVAAPTFSGGTISVPWTVNINVTACSSAPCPTQIGYIAFGTAPSANISITLAAITAGTSATGAPTLASSITLSSPAGTSTVYAPNIASISSITLTTPTGTSTVYTPTITDAVALATTPTGSSGTNAPAVGANIAFLTTPTGTSTVYAPAIASTSSITLVTPTGTSTAYAPAIGDNISILLVTPTGISAVNPPAISDAISLATPTGTSTTNAPALASNIPLVTPTGVSTVFAPTIASTSSITLVTPTGTSTIFAPSIAANSSISLVTPTGTSTTGIPTIASAIPLVTPSGVSTSYTPTLDVCIILVEPTGTGLAYVLTAVTSSGLVITLVTPTGTSNSFALSPALDIIPSTPTGISTAITPAIDVGSLLVTPTGTSNAFAGTAALNAALTTALGTGVAYLASAGGAISLLLVTGTGSGAAFTPNIAASSSIALTTPTGTSAATALLSDIEIALTTPTGLSAATQLRLDIGIALITPDGFGEAYSLEQEEKIVVVCIATVDTPLTVSASIDASYVIDLSQQTPMSVITSEDSRERIEATTDTAPRITAIFGG